MIVLYNPPSNPRRKPILPMSLLALGALLEGEHPYRIVDGNLEAQPAETLDRVIHETGASTLGITVMPGPQLADAVPTSRFLKQRHPDLTIVWGGYFPTQHYEACLRGDEVDYVVRGHGERTFKALVDLLARGEDPTILPGLAYRDPATGEPKTNPLAAIPHPDRLPDFPYHQLDLSRYLRHTFLGRRTISHHSSYGCPFTCNFCAVVNMVNGRWLAQSADRVAGVVRRFVEQWQVDAIEFYDNNFFVQEARTAEFAERIRSLNVSWWGEARIDTLLRYSDRNWALMRDGGLRMVFMGAESGSNETLRRMNKGGTASTEKTLEIAAKMARYEIIPEFSFVLGSPPDPEEDVRHTLEFVRRLKGVNPAAEVIFYLYTPVPLSGELYEQAKARGFVFPETLDEWLSPTWNQFAQRRSGQLPWLDQKVRRSIRDFERVLNAYYPTTTNPRLRGPWRWILRAASAWRYRSRIYRYPIELRAIHRFIAYQRPETAGF
ncbi:MAG TPA: radical SAM protein [Chloroflexota bacterium]|nr:radical SAM protein [Chloroflexota bacterium]